MTTVSIIIPVLNQIAHTEQCLQAIFRNSHGIDLEIIVIDNASSDQSAEVLKKLSQKHQELKVLSNSTNLGYSKANNQGAQIAQGKYLLLLNNDTIPRAGWLSELLKAACGDKVGLCGSKLVYPMTNNINHAGYVYNRQICKFYPIYHEFAAAHPAVNKAREFQALLGACVLLSRELYLSLGGLREFGLEDVDLCLRVRKEGYKVLYCPKSEVAHYGSLTLKNSPVELLAKATSKEFNSHWPVENLSWDDLHFYEADGFNFEINAAGEFILERKDRPFYALLTDALQRIEKGELQIAEQELRKAQEIDAGNKELLIQFATLELKRGDVAAARNWLCELIKVDTLHLEAYQLAAELSMKMGDTHFASEILAQMRRLPDLPFEVLS